MFNVIQLNSHKQHQGKVHNNDGIFRLQISYHAKILNPSYGNKFDTKISEELLRQAHRTTQCLKKMATETFKE